MFHSHNITMNVPRREYLPTLSDSVNPEVVQHFSFSLGLFSIEECSCLLYGKRSLWGWTQSCGPVCGERLMFPRSSHLRMSLHYRWITRVCICWTNEILCKNLFFNYTNLSNSTIVECLATPRFFSAASFPLCMLPWPAGWDAGKSTPRPR